MTIQSIIREIAASSNPFKKGHVISRCEQEGVKVSQSKFERAAEELNCTKPKRGWYLLPEQPIVEQQVTTEQVTTEQPVVQEQVVVEETEPVVEVPVVLASNTWIPVLDQVDGEMFAEDMSSTPDHLSLKDIALLGQKCFGKYYPDNICGSCPLKGSCQVATYAKIEAWAQELMEEELPAPEETETTAPVETETTEEQGTSTSKQNLTVSFDTICSKCRNVITAGTEFVNQVGVGNLHPQCV